MKSIIKYIAIFVISVFILFSLLVITAKIPREIIQDNIKQSQNAFRTTQEIDEVVKRREYTFLHPYSDAALLNIIYCIDTNHPIKSVMEAKYYTNEYDNVPSTDLKELVENNHEGNVQYIRYWHGSMSIIRPLLIIFNLKQIYIINAFLLAGLVIGLIVILLKKKQKLLVTTFIIGLIMCATIMVPFCLEYTWMFLIMLVTSIIAVKIEKDDKKLNILFFITGIITCFLDFLSTEVITILVPVIMVLVIRYQENRINFKEGIKFIFKSCALWFISYAFMWVAKWILASIILNVNSWEYVKDNAMTRINGEVLGTTKQTLAWKAVTKNFFTLYPLNIQKRKIKLIIIPIVLIIVEAIFIRKKDLKKLWISGLLLFIALIPYIRYFLIANHSYKHFFFTFRSQLPSVMAFILAMIYSMDKNIVTKEIKLKGRKKGTENGINNINTRTK